MVFTKLRRSLLQLHVHILLLSIERFPSPKLVNSVRLSGSVINRLEEMFNVVKLESQSKPLLIIEVI